MRSAAQNTKKIDRATADPSPQIELHEATRRRIDRDRRRYNALRRIDRLLASQISRLWPAGPRHPPAPHWPPPELLRATGRVRCRGCGRKRQTIRV